MKTTGYMIREAIKMWELRRDTAAGAYPGSLFAFPEEKKEKPTAIVEQFLTSEKAIAKLHVAQSRYNLAVTCEVQGEKMTLEEVIKRIGGPARAEKLWRQAAGPKTDRYGYNSDQVRNEGQVVASKTIETKEAMKLASEAAKTAGKFRQAIATGNTREVEIEDLDPALFE